MSATLTMLVSFDGDGDETVGDLIADANGDLFGRPRTAALMARGQGSKWPIRETSTSRSTTARLSSMAATRAERFSLSEARDAASGEAPRWEAPDMVLAKPTCESAFEFDPSSLRQFKRLPRRLGGIRTPRR
jgi:hypothetical protein